MAPPTATSRSARPAPTTSVEVATTVVYGLDIETDTTIDGLDPLVAPVVAVAVAGPDGVTTFDDRNEALLLDRLDWHLASIEPGVIATWNGANFDLPFLHHRARIRGVDLGLRLRPDPVLPLPREPLPGRTLTSRAWWHGHAHLDAYRLYRADVVPALGVSGGLKSIAQLCGLAPVVTDASQLHQLTRADIRAYVSSDARCTRELVLRRWPTARRAIDRAGEAPALAVGGAVVVPRASEAVG
jgi:hypothetical protein